MNEFLGLVVNSLTEGFLYAVLALGVYITYSILDFPDLSVDGTVPLGATVAAVLMLRGLNPWLATLAAFLVGAAAGCVTGLLHVKLKIRPLLCGILVMTALLSVNLVIMKAGTDGGSTASLFNEPTIFNTLPVSVLPKYIGGYALRALILVIVLSVVSKLLLDWYFSTRSGMLLRATGSNEQFVTMLARNPGTSKIIGLALGNGFAAVAGAAIAQNTQTASLQIGPGMVVIGLASLIIGISLLQKVRFMKATTKVIVGAIIYKACLTVADAFELSDWLKLIMAVLCVLALVFSNVMEKGRRPSRG